MKSSQFIAKKIYVIFEDDLIYENFKDDFRYYFSKKLGVEIKILKDFEINSIFDKAAHLSSFGWKKEAIPILQTKSSIITRIFKTLFE